MSVRRERNVYIAVMVAFAKGQGLNLSFDEVAQIRFDDAIETMAVNSLTEEEWRAIFDTNDGIDGWAKIDAAAKRKPGNMQLWPEER